MHNISRRSALVGVLAGGAALSAFGPVAAAGKPQFGTFGIDPAGMDKSVSPGEDFFRFVNGAWLRSNTIPPDRSRWSEFDRLGELSDQYTKAILEQASGPAAAGIARKVGEFYASYMDEAAIERLGASPLKPDLDRIAAISTLADLATAFAWITRDTTSTLPIGFGIGVDQKTPTRYTTSLGQGGLGLPDRDYYLVDQPAFVANRTAYRKHIAAMFALAGIADGAGKAERIYALEEKLARTHWSRIESRDSDKTYNVWQTSEFAGKASGFDWVRFFTGLAVENRPNFVVRQPGALTAFAALAPTVAMADWRDYLSFHLISSSAGVLSKAFVDENFDFSGRTLNGTPELAVRWKRGVAATNAALGDAVGRLYAARHFPPESKVKAQALITNVKAALAKRIQGLTWMTPPTKQKALTKLASLRVEVGYEEKPRDYSSFQVVRGDAYGNRMRSIRYETEREMGRLTRPVDRGEWSMTAATVNASSNFTLVKVMFPAAILQPPFFDPNADPAVNYGGIGVVIGHEISHQFDDQGSKYDSTGKLENWWTEADLTQFKAAAQKLSDQYDAYEPLPGMHIQGALTLGENIGDLAGIAIARDAYVASLGGRPAPVIEGYTGDQRFFMGYAQVWRQLVREAAARQRLTTDPHSPGEYRAYTVRNVDAWHTAFNVRAGQKLYLPQSQRVVVW